MAQFNVAVDRGRDIFRFAVNGGAVLFAGSRHGTVIQRICLSLIQGLGDPGFSFLVGCAPGVDESFRKVLAVSRFRTNTFVGCAFGSRTRQVEANDGLTAHLVVPAGLSAKAALRRRTLYLVKRCCMAVIFPVDPTTGSWGRGSTLAFRATLQQLKPVFVVADRAPESSEHYRVLKAQLCGVSGYWAVPHPIYDGGPCDEEW